MGDSFESCGARMCDAVKRACTACAIVASQRKYRPVREALSLASVAGSVVAFALVVQELPCALLFAVGWAVGTATLVWVDVQTWDHELHPLLPSGARAQCTGCPEHAAWLAAVNG